MASMHHSGTVSPKTILPIPKSVAYTATMPAIQFVQASAPPGIVSRP